jgi:hypothetical protein
MDIKYRINKIHSDLTNNFTNVNIEQKSNKLGNFFELLISEKYDIRIQIKFSDLEYNNINWVYYSNPLDINSTIVERNSTLETITNDIKDILYNKRFSYDYIQKIDI